MRCLDPILAQGTRIWWEWEVGMGYSDREGFPKEVSVKKGLEREKRWAG